MKYIQRTIQPASLLFDAYFGNETCGKKRGAFVSRRRIVRFPRQFRRLVEARNGQESSMSSRLPDALLSFRAAHGQLTAVIEMSRFGTPCSITSHASAWHS